MSLNHICLNGKVDVDLDVKSLSIQGVPVPVGSSSLFYKECVSIPNPIVIGTTPVIINTPLNAVGSNLWTPSVGDVLSFDWEAQLASSTSGNTLDFKLLYDSGILIESSFNLLSLNPILNSGSGLQYSGSIYCNEKTEISPGIFTYTFVSSLRVQSSGTLFLLMYSDEVTFSTGTGFGNVEIQLATATPGEVLTTSLTIEKNN